jgi:hypothetical protein
MKQARKGDLIKDIIHWLGEIYRPLIHFWKYMQCIDINVNSIKNMNYSS